MYAFIHACIYIYEFCICLKKYHQMLNLIYLFFFQKNPSFSLCAQQLSVVFFPVYNAPTVFMGLDYR